MSLKRVGWLGQTADRHDHCYPTHDTVEASPDVYAEGFKVVRVGDAVAPHEGSCSKHPTPHGATVQTGSASVFVNGKPLAREGDLVQCDTGETAPLLEGREKVLAGDASPVATKSEAEPPPEQPQTIQDSEQASPSYRDGDVVAADVRGKALATLKQNNAHGRGLRNIRPEEIAALLFKYRDPPQQKPGVPMARMSPEAESTLGPPTDDPVSRSELQTIVRRVLVAPESTPREMFIAQRLDANYAPLSLLSRSGGGIDYVALEAATRGGILGTVAPAHAPKPPPSTPSAKPSTAPSPAPAPSPPAPATTSEQQQAIGATGGNEFPSITVDGVEYKHTGQYARTVNGELMLVDVYRSSNGDMGYTLDSGSFTRGKPPQ